MCVNQKCMSVADLRASVSGGKACPNNCNGNGVCNSLGHCHCNRGFRPPDCLHPGIGGSEDSGPAEDPNGGYLTYLYLSYQSIRSKKKSRVFSILNNLSGKITLDN